MAAEGMGLTVNMRGSLVHVDLARVAERNAIQDEMVAALSGGLDGWARSPDIYAVALTSSVSGVFSIGTDLPRLMAARQLGISDVARLLARDYALFWQIDCFTKPIVSLINGSIAGAALGLTLLGTHRVAQEQFFLSVPDVSIGMVPQAGLGHWLARMPDHIGMYLALSGRGLGRADALAFGLVTHAIDGRHSHDIQRQLADAQPVDPILDTLHRDPGPRDLDYFAPVIARCFSADTVEEIVARLNRERGQTQLWAEGVQRDMARHSPLALKVAHRLVKRCATLDLRDALIVTHGVLTRMILSGDFEVGVNAARGARDRSPQWSSVSWQRIGEDAIDRIFVPLEADGLVLPGRVAMQRR